MSYNPDNILPLCNQRQTYSSTIPISQKDLQFYQQLIKKRRKQSYTRNLRITKHQLIEPNTRTQNTITLFSELFQEIFDNPSLLCPIYYDTPYRYLEKITELLSDSILSNPFAEVQNHLLISVIENIMEFEFNNTQDLSCYLRENTAATKLIGLYLKRDDVATSINEIIGKICPHCLQNYQQDLEIEPSEVLIQYIDYILDTIMKPSLYPYGLRVLCKKLKQLAISRDPENKNASLSLIGGLMFLRILNPKIAYYGKLKSMEGKYIEYAGCVRRKFGVIAYILQNIIGGYQPRRYISVISPMSDYIMSKREIVSIFFDELTNVAPFTRYRYFAFDEYIYISITDLKLLISTIVEDQNKNKHKITATNKRYYDLIQQITSRQLSAKTKDLEPHVMICVAQKQRNELMIHVKDKYVDEISRLRKEAIQMKEYHSRLERKILSLCTLNGELSRLKEALSHLPFTDLNATDSKNMTLLDYAIHAKYLDMIKFLCKCGATKYQQKILDEKSKRERKKIQKAMFCGFKILQNTHKINENALLNSMPWFPTYICKLVMSYNNNVSMLQANNEYN